MRDLFRHAAEVTANVAGSSVAFMAMVGLTVVWLLIGPRMGFSDTWQLTMNTIASQATFLIAFLLQNSQNRDTRALQLKLDELLRASDQARNDLIHLERLSDDQLSELENEFARLRQQRAEQSQRSDA